MSRVTAINLPARAFRRTWDTGGGTVRAHCGSWTLVLLMWRDTIDKATAGVSEVAKLRLVRTNSRLLKANLGKTGRGAHFPQTRFSVSLLFLLL